MAGANIWNESQHGLAALNWRLGDGSDSSTVGIDFDATWWRDQLCIRTLIRAGRRRP